jgi:hypothetical protein
MSLRSSAERMLGHQPVGPVKVYQRGQYDGCGRRRVASVVGVRREAVRVTPGDRLG